MKNREPRLQSLAVQSALEDLEDLRGQVLADATFERKVAALRRRAQREILGSFGKALEAFSGHWRALDKRHEAERARFMRREGSVLGRVLNALPHAPASLAAGYAHFRDSLQWRSPSYSFTDDDENRRPERPHVCAIGPLPLATG